MPLIVVTGKPASGKSTVTDRICKFIQARRPEPEQVEVISDDRNTLFARSIYNDSQKEREHRGVLRSEVQRLLSKDRLVICDSLNYIKGFRYELFCVAKLVQTTYCVVYCDATENACQWLNLQKDEAERYGTDNIRELIMRFEEPVATNRWDSPLLTVKVGASDENGRMFDTVSEQNMYSCGPREAQLPLDDMYNWLFQGKRLPANQSTQSVPFMSADFLHVLDRATQEVVSAIIQQQRNALPGDAFVVPNCALGDDKVLFTRQRSLAELSKLRRQFISYMKMHPVKDTSKFASLFVDYLNANS